MKKIRRKKQKYIHLLIKKKNVKINLITIKEVPTLHKSLWLLYSKHRTMCLRYRIQLMLYSFGDWTKYVTFWTYEYSKYTRSYVGIYRYKRTKKNYIFSAPSVHDFNTLFQVNIIINWAACKGVVVCQLNWS